MQKEGRARSDEVGVAWFSSCVHVTSFDRQMPRPLADRLSVRLPVTLYLYLHVCVSLSLCVSGTRLARVAHVTSSVTSSQGP